MYFNMQRIQKQGICSLNSMTMAEYGITGNQSERAQPHYLQKAADGREAPRFCSCLEVPRFVGVAVI